MPSYALMLLAIAAPQAAAPQAPVASDARATTSAAATYQLGADDEIEMRVVGQPELTLKTRINADGTISAPLIGVVTAAGKTTADLSRELERHYSRERYLINPSINVEVINYGSKTATVLGAVPKAGLYPLDRPYSVAAIIARAGGSREGGANSVILTPAGGQAVRISLGDPSGAAGRIVQPGDTLFVPPAEKVYVYGEVNKGGAFEFLPGMTFRQALALAGGPTLAGSTKRIEVRRDGRKVAATLDDQVRPEDVLVIKEKLF